MIKLTIDFSKLSAKPCVSSILNSEKPSTWWLYIRSSYVKICQIFFACLWGICKPCMRLKAAISEQVKDRDCSVVYPFSHASALRRYSEEKENMFPGVWKCMIANFEMATAEIARVQRYWPTFLHETSWFLALGQIPALSDPLYFKKFRCWPYETCTPLSDTDCGKVVEGMNMVRYVENVPKGVRRTLHV